MENTNTVAAAVRNETYSKLVSGARDLARHALRTRNIRSQVEAIGALNLSKSNLLKEAKLEVEQATHGVEKATYQLAKKNLDSNLGDPDFKNAVKVLQENLDEANKVLDEANKFLVAVSGETDEEVVRINKEIEACNKKILGWETGDNHVKLENVDKLAQEYIEKALNEKARALSALLG